MVDATMDNGKTENNTELENTLHNLDRYVKWAIGIRVKEKNGLMTTTNKKIKEGKKLDE